MSILSLFLRKNFQYRCCISRENRSKRFVKIYLCFITYKDLHSHDFLCFAYELLNESLKNIYTPLYHSLDRASWEKSYIIKNEI